MPLYKSVINISERDASDHVDAAAALSSGCVFRKSLLHDVTKITEHSGMIIFLIILFITINLEG
jgi:hypothetical protein